MKNLFRTSFVVALAIFGAAACNSAEPRDVETEADVTDAFAEIPVRSSRLPGAATWRFTLEAHGGRALALDEAGEVLVELSMAVTDETITIRDEMTAERIVVSPDGQMLESTIQDGSYLPQALGGMSEDIQAYRAENPDRPQGCGWDLFTAWANCATMAGVCSHPFTAAIVCGGFVMSCGLSAGDFYTNCM